MQQDDPSPEFDPADYTAERTAVRIREFRDHLRDELLPGAKDHPQTTFLVPFVQYLDAQSARFEASLSGPMDVLALSTRNLLELFSLMNHVFTNQQARDQFFGEIFLDAQEIRDRLEKLGIPRKVLSDGPPEWYAVPQKRVPIMRDDFDDYFFKLCSKYIHPSAISIFAQVAMPRAFIFCFSGSNYLARSYNFLFDRVFKAIDYRTDESVF